MWTRTPNKFATDAQLAANWQVAHHLIPKMMLHHAISKSKLEFYDFQGFRAPDYARLGLPLVPIDATK